MYTCIHIIHIHIIYIKCIYIHIHIHFIPVQIIYYNYIIINILLHRYVKTSAKKRTTVAREREDLKNQKVFAKKAPGSRVMDVQVRKCQQRAEHQFNEKEGGMTND